MKKFYFILSGLMLGTTLSFAQYDDDMYYVPAKKSEVKKATQTYYSGSDRSIDDYNRRGKYQHVEFDVDSILSENGALADTAVQVVNVYNITNYNVDNDYSYSRDLGRWYGWSGFYWGDPWYWHSSWYWNDPWYWHDPWYWRGSWYHAYYHPWHSSWVWRDPWYYPTYHYGHHYPVYISHGFRNPGNHDIHRKGNGRVDRGSASLHHGRNDRGGNSSYRIGDGNFRGNGNRGGAGLNNGRGDRGGISAGRGETTRGESTTVTGNRSNGTVSGNRSNGNGGSSSTWTSRSRNPYNTVANSKSEGGSVASQGKVRSGWSHGSYGGSNASLGSRGSSGSRSSSAPAERSSSASGYRSSSSSSYSGGGSRSGGSSFSGGSHSSGGSRSSGGGGHSGRR